MSDMEVKVYYKGCHPDLETEIRKTMRALGYECIFSGRNEMDGQRELSFKKKEEPEDKRDHRPLTIHHSCFVNCPKIKRQLFARCCIICDDYHKGFPNCILCKHGM